MSLKFGNSWFSWLKKNYSLIIGITVTTLFISFFLFQGYSNDLFTLLLSAIFVVIITITLLFRYPKVWIYIVILSGSYFFYDTNEGVSVADVILSVFYVVSLLLWFVKIIFIKREKIISNWGDWSLLCFFCLLPLNFILMLISEVDLMLFVKIMPIVFMLLYYFPVKYYFKNEKELTLLLILFAIAAFVVELRYYFSYLNNFTKVKFAYQVMNATKQNSGLFTMASSVSFLFFFIVKKKWLKIILIAYTLSSVGILTLTMARTFWMILIVHLITMFLVFPFKRKLNMVFNILILGFLFFLSFNLYFNWRSDILFAMFENRFESTTKGKQDISVVSRLEEFKVITSKITESPLAGHGFGSIFSFYNPLSQNTFHAYFSHNSYFFFSFHFGIPMAFIFFFPFYYFSIYSLILAFKYKNEHDKLFSLISFLIITVFLISTLSTTIILVRDTPLICGIAFAVATFNINKSKIINKEKMINGKT
jgi:hypothetical protein